MKCFQIFELLVLAAAGTAIPLDRREITAQQLSTLGLFAQYSATSYCNNGNAPGQLVVCGSNACPLVQAAGAITSLAFTSPILDTRGLIALDPVRSLIVVTFRGSTSVRNWATDFTFPQIPCPLALGCLVHVGFATAWAEVSSQIIAGVAAARVAHPTYAVVVTGHSLGGAIATLATTYLRRAGHPADLYTYGSPRVGNSVFAQYVTEQAGNEYRVTHTDEPVPKLPPVIANFRHISPEYWITTDENQVSASDITVCTGHATVSCNAGTPGVNASAHVWYFGPISGCSPESLILPLKNRNGQVLGREVIDDAVKLRWLTDLDIQAVGNMNAASDG